MILKILNVYDFSSTFIHIFANYDNFPNRLVTAFPVLRIEEYTLAVVNNVSKLAKILTKTCHRAKMFTTGQNLFKYICLL